MASQEDDGISVDGAKVDVHQLLFWVQNNPPIYNSSIKEYHNADIISKIWTDIGKELNVPGNVCKKKWTNLRGSYVRYLKDLKKIPSGSRQQKKKWHLFDAMNFLQPWTGTTRKMTANSDDSLQKDADLKPTQDINESQAEREVEDDSQPVFEKQNNFNPSKKLRRTTVDMVAAPMVEYLKTLTKAEDAKVDSAMLTFLRSLVPEAETLTPRRQRLFKSSVMSQLHSLLDEQEIEQSCYTASPASMASSSNSAKFNQQVSILNKADGNHAVT